MVRGRLWGSEEKNVKRPAEVARSEEEHHQAGHAK